MRRLTPYFIVVLLFFSCKRNAISFKKLKGSIFGTTYNITYQANKNYKEDIQNLFFKINKTLSTYLPTSDISKINRNDSTVVLNNLFIEVFKKSKKIYKETNGYFDPTLAKIIDAYGFGSGKAQDSLTPEKIEQLMKMTGFDKVTLKNGKIEKQIPEIEFNVNSIAKGYGIDIVGRFLEEKNIKNYLIEIGGEIRVRGKNPKGKNWTVAIDDPNTDGTRSQSRFVKLQDESLASSGNYRKFKIDDNGNKFVHTINPKTGLAKESNLLSATVFAKKDCADVDAYATAFMAMGLEKTLVFLKKHPKIKVILLYVEEGKKETIKEYANF